MPVGIGTPAVDGLTNGQTNWGPSVKADIDALNGQFALAAINTYRPGSASALSSLTGMRAGDYAVRTDTGITYRYSGSAWLIWEWLNVPVAGTSVAIENGSSFDTTDGQMEVNIASGVLIVNFNVYKSSGMSIGTAYMRMQPGFRPAGTVNCSGYTADLANASQAAGTFVIDSTGGLVLRANGGNPAVTYRGTASYRVAG